ncbi:MAG: hypothetical protein HYT15_00110 [Candidatus Magasanikbacteria bacterium]|nr:hypothetical protein [Candidatus Magasanikbacteria bacterium]
MFGKFFGEKKSPPIHSEPDDINAEDVAGERLSADIGIFERSLQISSPLLEGVSKQIREMGFSVGDIVEIEYDGKKRVGEIGAVLVSPTPLLPTPLSDAKPGIRIEFNDTNNWINFDLKKIISGEVKMTKIR